MAGDAKKLQPIIVKKVRKAGHAAHGGAWKIAYADFVTAMMAFFLLMWLLGSTTDGDKKGIADYFQSPLKVAMSGGSGSGDASHVIKGGGQDLSRSTGQVKNGEVEAQRRTINLKALRAEQRRAEAARLQRLMDDVNQRIAQNPALAPVANQIRLEITAEGLRIQITDEQDRPMFDSGSARVQPHMREVLRTIGTILADVPNRITIEGHTDARPFAGAQVGYTNWELSADRANASRRELAAGGMPGERVLRVQGLADSRPLVATEPLAPTNRRISIVVMNRDAEDRALERPVDPGPESPAEGEVQGAALTPTLRPDLAPQAQPVPAPSPQPAGSSRVDANR